MVGGAVVVLMTLFVLFFALPLGLVLLSLMLKLMVFLFVFVAIYWVVGGKITVTINGQETGYVRWLTYYPKR